MQVDVSGLDGRGAEVFNVNAVGCARLSKIIGEEEILFGRGLIICKNFDVDSIKRHLDRLLQTIAVESIPQLVNEFSKFFAHI